MMACVAAEAGAEHRNVTAVALDPGMLKTDLMDEKVLYTLFVHTLRIPCEQS